MINLLCCFQYHTCRAAYIGMGVSSLWAGLQAWGSVKKTQWLRGDAGIGLQQFKTLQQAFKSDNWLIDHFLYIYS